MLKTTHLFHIMFLFIILFSPNWAFGQTEVTAWGNIQGIKVEGDLFRFGTSLRVVGDNWKTIQKTAKERQSPQFHRDGNKQIVSTALDSIYFTEIVEDKEKGKANLKVKYTVKSDTFLTGIYFCLLLPQNIYNNGSLKINSEEITEFQNLHPDDHQVYLQKTASSIKFISEERQLEVYMNEPTMIIVKKEEKDANLNGDILIYFTIASGELKKNATGEKNFTINVTGKVDKKPVEFTLNKGAMGRPFDGIGGNFRLQNPKTDPQVIDYCLDNLNVTWGRVEMPWRFWQAELNTDPIKTKKEALHPKVKAAMEMAQRLNKRDIPIILSNWSAPDWAIKGPFHYQPINGIWGNALNEDNMLEIYKSIGDYIEYMKENFGVEATYFSFNESDLGINIRQTPEEHAKLIKGLGAFLQSRGLKTKILLGDNSDANSFDFIKVAMDDAQALPYIGAISFHSWRGWADTTLTKWANAATKLNKPLIVGEGSIDAAAWRYPEIFEENIYAMEEINLYIKLLAICQPLSILQWQLTADYSPLSGGGIFGNNAPLHPTTRFWNLKQLSATPKESRAVEITSDSPTVTCAALFQPKNETYTIHLVNNGATRPSTIKGLPKELKQLRIFVTDEKRNNKEEKMIGVSNGKAQFTLPAESFTTLMGH